jgi:hypothetical protein
VRCASIQGRCRLGLPRQGMGHHASRSANRPQHDVNVGSRGLLQRCHDPRHCECIGLRPPDFWWIVNAARSGATVELDESARCWVERIDGNSARTGTHYVGHCDARTRRPAEFIGFIRIKRWYGNGVSQRAKSGANAATLLVGIGCGGPAGCSGKVSAQVSRHKRFRRKAEMACIVDACIKPLSAQARIPVSPSR